MIYFKQAWQILKQNPFYGIIYIIGTGISVALIMMLVIVLNIKTANIYPETARDRMLIVKYGEIIRKDGRPNVSRLSLDMMKQCIYSLQTTGTYTVVYDVFGEILIQPDNSTEQLKATAKYVDPGFWNVFSFHFMDGKPFNEADMQSGIKTVVICESTARQLFGTTEVTGKHLSINFDTYQICGVVKDVPYLADKAYAQFWIPYTAHPSLTTSWPWSSGTLGSFVAYVVAPSTKEVKKVRDEIRTNIDRFASSVTDVTFSAKGQPDTQWVSLFRLSNRLNIDANKIVAMYGLLFFTLLLIPAVSISGMTDSQMDNRMSEFGIRRTFGAYRQGIVRQLIFENFLFTAIGAVFGLLLSYILLLFFRKWIIHIGTAQIFVSAVPQGADVGLTPSMLLNFPVFGVVLCICILLNLMITVIPAWRTSRRQIIYALNHKK